MLAYTHICDLLAERGLTQLTSRQAADLNRWIKIRKEVVKEQMAVAELAETSALEHSTILQNIFKLNRELKSIEKILKEFPIVD